MENKLTYNRILIMSHFYVRTMVGGPPQEVRDYFLDKTKYLYYIEHPFSYADDPRSILTIYKNGKN